MRFTLVICLLCSALQMQAQKNPDEINIKDEPIPAGITAVVTRHTVTLKDLTKISYTAHTGYLNLKNDTGKSIAKVFFT